MKFKIGNRKNLKIAVEVEGDLLSDKLVFITHGLNGSKDQPHMIGMREVFLASGYIVVSFDATCSFGESDGDSMDATATSYIADLNDVIRWAQQQEWYKEPFALAGHSLGGLSSLVYASKNSDKVNAIFPMSTVVSGELFSDAQNPEQLKAWKEKGYYFKESKSMPGKSGKVGYRVVEDLLNYDVLDFAADVRCPVLLIVGLNDKVTPPEAHELLYDKLGGPKELFIIEGMGHTPRTQQKIDEMKGLVKGWLNSL